MSNGHVQEGEFVRAIEGLSGQVAKVETLARDTLAEARKTNGRVSFLEISKALHDARLEAIEKRAEPITRRDLWVAVFAISSVFGAAKYLPALLHIGSTVP